MEPGFERIITIVIVAGLAVFGAGGTLLFLSLRGFAKAKPGEIKHIVLLVIAIAFIFFVCVALLVWSLVFGR